MNTGSKLLLLALLSTLSACGEEENSKASDEMEAREDPTLWNASFEEMEALKGDTSTCSGVTVPDQSGFNKRVAFTFDDGPNLSTTPALLEALRRHEVPATFFINQVRGGESSKLELLKEMVADPLFIVGNHTWSHPNMRQKEEERVIAEIDQMTAVLDEVGEIESPRFFRFPFGSSNCMTYGKVQERGYFVTGWHIDTADWCFNAGEKGYCDPGTFAYVPDEYRRDIQGFSMQQIRRREGGVILFHDIHQFSVDQVEPLILKLKEEGYSFVNLDDEDTFPLLNGVEASFIGDPCIEEAECNVGQFCIAGFCSLSCEGYCPDRADRARTFCVEDPREEQSGGICVSKSEEINGHCADLEGSLDMSISRFVGQSSAQEGVAEVCMPQISAAEPEEG